MLVMILPPPPVKTRPGADQFFCHLTRAVSERLSDAIERVGEILEIAGVPAISFGIIKDGETLGTYHLGRRDMERNLPPDDKTRYNINSLSKGIMSTLVGIQVHDGAGGLEWSTRLKTLLPAFGGSTPEIASQSTIVDLLSHRWGTSGFDDFWFGCDNAVFLPRSETFRSAATLAPAIPFRDTFEYNNWGYEIAGQLLETLSGQDVATLLQEKLVMPLGLNRTSLSWGLDNNEAKSYGILFDKSHVQVAAPFHDDSLVMKSAGGVKSSLEDLLVFYRAWMRDVVSQFDGATDSSPESPLKNLRTISSQHARFPGPSLHEQGYGLGWARAQLPGQLGRISGNAILGEQPVVGKGGPSRLVLYHHGLMPGSTSAVLLVPALQSGIVTLQNSMPAIDTADFAAQMLLEGLLDVPEPNDYVELSRQFYDKAMGFVHRVRKELDDKRVPDTKARPLAEYQGRYWNNLRNFFIDVEQQHESDGGSRLVMTVNGLAGQAYKLEHYNFDTFSWLMSYDEMVRRARVLFYGPEYFLVEFRSSKGAGVDELVWAADANFPDAPVILSKTGIQDCWRRDTLRATTRQASWLGGLLLLGVLMAVIFRPWVSRRTRPSGYAGRVPLKKDGSGVDL
jgi:CubicO group peptidase (beta-lactamase class C family)